MCMFCFSFIPGSYKIPAYVDAPFKSNEKCPVVIFSHGLGAFRFSTQLLLNSTAVLPHCNCQLIDTICVTVSFLRTLYSAICAELASQGFIVASVEHR